jgi:hypothetical protein
VGYQLLASEGEEAVSGLSIGDERDRWVVSGRAFRELLLQRMWHPASPWATSARDRIVNIVVPELTAVN